MQTVAELVSMVALLIGIGMMISGGLLIVGLSLAVSSNYVYRKTIGAVKLSQVIAEAKRQGRPLFNDDTKAH